MEKSYSISAVDRDTGIGRDTLRIWEWRYGYPGPQSEATRVSAGTRLARYSAYN